MTDKRYCLGCGSSIPEARLEALPETMFCVRCAQKAVKPIVDESVLATNSKGGRNGFAGDD